MSGRSTLATRTGALALMVAACSAGQESPASASLPGATSALAAPTTDLAQIETSPSPAPPPEPAPPPPPPQTHPEVPIPAPRDSPLAADPKAASSHFAAGVTHILAGRSEQAVRAYQAAAEADPSCAKCYWELGWALQKRNDWLGCAVAWNQVQALDPSFPELAEHLPTALAHRDLAWRMHNTPAPAPSAPPLEPSEGRSLSIAAVGDITMGRAWPNEALPSNEGADLFAALTATLHASELTFGNLETVLADDGASTKCEGSSPSACFAFRVPTSYAAHLEAAGFDLLSIANNHAGDFGPAGRRSTLAALDAHGLLHSGPVGDIATWTRDDGLELAMVAFATGPGSYRLTEIELAARVVAELAAAHDLVMVSFHGGAEGSRALHVPAGSETFLGEDRGDLRAFTHAVVDAGADLVVGHGPHVLRGIELYRGRLIAYSLGNFSGWRTFGLTGPSGISAVLKVELAANGVALAAHLEPLRLIAPGRPEPDPERTAIASIRGLSKADFGQAVFDSNGTWQR